MINTFPSFNAHLRLFSYEAMMSMFIIIKQRGGVWNKSVFLGLVELYMGRSFVGTAISIGRQNARGQCASGRVPQHWLAPPFLFQKRINQMDHTIVQWTWPLCFFLSIQLRTSIMPVLYERCTQPHLQRRSTKSVGRKFNPLSVCLSVQAIVNLSWTV